MRVWELLWVHIQDSQRSLLLGARCSAYTYKDIVSGDTKHKRIFSAKINVWKEQKLGELWLPW